MNKPQCSQVRVILDALGIVDETAVRACEKHAQWASRASRQGDLDTYENEKSIIAAIIRKREARGAS